MYGADLPTTLDELLPVIRARRDEIEQARTMPRDLVDALRRAAVFSLSVPRAYGGREARPTEMMQTFERIAAVDASTGWCAMVGTANNLSAGYMDDAGAREVVTDVNGPSAGIAAPAGTAVRRDGGVQVSGRWPFATGIMHCDWLWVGCIVVEDGQPKMTPAGPEIVHAWMPASEVTIHDTWRVSGLCGTGSHDVSASGVFVPDRRVYDLFDPARHRPEPLYQMPSVSLFVFQVAAVCLGIARGALDELATLAQAKVPSMYTQVLADRPVAQVEIARAEAALGSAHAFVYERAEEMWHTICDGRTPTLRQVALGRAASTQAAETAAAVTRTASALAGGTAIYSSSSLQRHARDAEALLHHFTVAPHTWEQAGRVLLERDAGVAVF